MKFEGWTDVFQGLQWLYWLVTFLLPLFEESVSERFHFNVAALSFLQKLCVPCTLVTTILSSCQLKLDS
jgi:hypothetical protein